MEGTLAQGRPVKQDFATEGSGLAVNLRRTLGPLPREGDTSPELCACFEGVCRHPLSPPAHPRLRLTSVREASFSPNDCVMVGRREKAPIVGREREWGERQRQTEAERKSDREILFHVPLIIRPSNSPRLPSVYPEPGAVLDTSQETAFLQLGIHIRNLQGSLWLSRIFGPPEQRQ